MTNCLIDNKCPICGSLNSCRYSKQGNSEQKLCWCEITDYEFPVNLLARIPEKFKNKVCICERCVKVSQITGYSNGHSA